MMGKNKLPAVINGAGLVSFGHVCFFEMVYDFLFVLRSNFDFDIKFPV